MTNSIKPHQAAELFPLMRADEFDGLVADIREHGQREPIVLHDGLVLDGRNRLRACEVLGIAPRTVEWDLNGKPPEAFVISMNLHRRHLSESQRGVIAAKMATLNHGQHLTNSPDTEIYVSEMSQPQAAEMLNVSVATLQNAKTVLNHGTPEEIAAVERGDKTVGPLSKTIRARRPPKKPRKKKLSEEGKNPERIQRQKMHADIWEALGGALDALTSLPLPSDVVAIIRKNPNRQKNVDAKLSRALNWIQEFENVYRAE